MATRRNNKVDRVQRTRRELRADPGARKELHKALETEAAPEVKPLKHARSKAELTRVRQGWTLIALAVAQLSGTTILILSQVFHVL